MTAPVCGAPNRDGYPVTCTSAPHRGPHTASAPELGIASIAWCTPPEPCRGRLCGGPCHPDEPARKQP
jgi:hypothetical protein